jgi:molecular chaperone HtpG
MAAPNLKLPKATAPKEVRTLFYISTKTQLEFLEDTTAYKVSWISMQNFLPVPVQFGTKSESVEDGNDEEGKTKI